MKFVKFVVKFVIYKSLCYNQKQPQDVFCKKGVLKNFAKVTGKHRYQSLFPFNKVVGLRPATLLKNRPWHRCFPVNFVKFLGATIFRTHADNSVYIIVFSIPSGCSSLMKDLLYGMLKRNPKERMGFSKCDLTL